MAYRTLPSRTPWHKTWIGQLLKGTLTAVGITASVLSIEYALADYYLQYRIQNRYTTSELYKKPNLPQPYASPKTAIRQIHDFLQHNLSDTSSSETPSTSSNSSTSSSTSSLSSSSSSLSSPSSANKPIMFIYGPPGTGKTIALKDALCQINQPSDTSSTDPSSSSSPSSQPKSINQLHEQTRIIYIPVGDKDTDAMQMNRKINQILYYRPIYSTLLESLPKSFYQDYDVPIYKFNMYLQAIQRVSQQLQQKHDITTVLACDDIHNMITPQHVRVRAFDQTVSGIDITQRTNKHLALQQVIDLGQRWLSTLQQFVGSVASSTSTDTASAFDLPLNKSSLALIVTSSSPAFAAQSFDAAPRSIQLFHHTGLAIEEARQLAQTCVYQMVAKYHPAVPNNKYKVPIEQTSSLHPTPLPHTSTASPPNNHDHLQEFTFVTNLRKKKHQMHENPHEASRLNDSDFKSIINHVGTSPSSIKRIFSIPHTFDMVKQINAARFVASTSFLFNWTIDEASQRGPSALRNHIMTRCQTRQLLIDLWRRSNDSNKNKGSNQSQSTSNDISLRRWLNLGHTEQLFAAGLLDADIETDNIHFASHASRLALQSSFLPQYQMQEAESICRSIASNVPDAELADLSRQLLQCVAPSHTRSSSPSDSIATTL